MDESARLMRGLDLLAGNEIAMARLYAVYAELFSELHDFWVGLSTEEQHHATWVRTLRDEVINGGIAVQRFRFNLEAFEYFHVHLQRLITEALSAPPDSLLALSIARDMEKTYIEESFSQIFDSDDAHFTALLNRLRDSTQHHFATLDRVWNEQRIIHQPRHSPSAF